MLLDQIKLSDYSYELPEDKIAQKPLLKRDESKLLVYEKGEISHKNFNELGELLNSKHHLIMNNAKVIPARIHFYRNSGAKIEIFLLEPIAPFTQIERALSSKSPVVYKAMIGNLKKWKDLEVLRTEFYEENVLHFIEAKLLSKTEQVIELSWNSEMAFTQILELIGKTPLPPYIKREASEEDKNTYQTVFAKEEGAVAAPTAGLHFSESLLQTLKTKSVNTSEITLHVGAGTFAPVTVEYMKDHSMHSEFFSVNVETLQELCIVKKRIAVGTTSLRTLESLYWIGYKLKYNIPNPTEIETLFPYNRIKESLTWEDSLKTILNYLEERNLKTLHASTSILIMPGYRFKSVEGLITNFHFPKTTLILLVAAFIGGDWRLVYKEALIKNYRFLSYGDSSLLWRNS